MARITVEDCLVNENNRFSLVLLASRRAKALLEGKSPVTDTKGNKAVVSALREIASGKVRFRPEEAEEEDDLLKVDDLVKPALETPKLPTPVRDESSDNTH